MVFNKVFKKKSPVFFFLVTFPSMPQVTVPSRNHVSTTACALDSVEDSELMGEDLDSLLDQEPSEVKSLLCPCRLLH